MPEWRRPCAPWIEHFRRRCGRGRHVNALAPPDRVVVVDLDELRLIFAGEGNAGRAMSLVADDQVELG